MCNYLLERTTAPAAAAVSDIEMRGALRIADGEAVEDLTFKLQAATDHVEAATNRALITASWKLSLPDWPAGRVIELPVAPLLSVTSVTYLDTDAASQTLSSSLYTVTTPQGESARLGFLLLDFDAVWPSLDYDTSLYPVQVTFTAGYGSKSSDVPAALKAGLLLKLRALYDGETPALVSSMRACLAPYELHR